MKFTQLMLAGFCIFANFANAHAIHNKQKFKVKEIRRVSIASNSFPAKHFSKQHVSNKVFLAKKGSMKVRNSLKH